MNKPGSTRGRQTVVSFNYDLLRPHEHAHCHKLHQRLTSCTAVGCETCLILNKLTNIEFLFTEKPMIIIDNNFLDKAVVNEIGQRGFKVVATNHADKFSKGVPKMHWHAEKT